MAVGWDRLPALPSDSPGAVQLSPWPGDGGAASPPGGGAHRPVLAASPAPGLWRGPSRSGESTCGVLQVSVSAAFSTPGLVPCVPPCRAVLCFGVTVAFAFPQLFVQVTPDLHTQPLCFSSFQQTRYQFAAEGFLLLSVVSETHFYCSCVTWAVTKPFFSFHMPTQTSMFCFCSWLTGCTT